MRGPWHKDNPALLIKIEAETRPSFPNLHFYPDKDRVFIKGTFPVIQDGRVHDRYSIEIELPPNYPEALPIVREIGGRIPKTADRHINHGGEACLFIPDERWQVWPIGSSFLDFLNGPVRNFFIGQSLAELGQPWPFGQWPHGPDGIFEYYSTLLKTKDLTIILKYLEYLSKSKLKGYLNCPCGSGQPIRKCHIDQLKNLRTKIPPKIARQSRGQLSTLKKSKP